MRRVEAGVGQPAVVLEAGLNNGAASWQRVMPPLARRRASLIPIMDGVSELSGGVADGLVEDRQAERKFVLGGGQWRGDAENAAHAGQLHDVNVQA